MSDSTPRAGSVLILNRDLAAASALSAQLEVRGFDSQIRQDERQALEAIHAANYDAILAELPLGTHDDLSLVRTLVEARPALPLIVRTASQNQETAIKAVRAGAYDLVDTSLDISLLCLTLERAIAHRRLQLRLGRLLAKVGGRAPLSGLIGESPVMRRVTDLIPRVAESAATVLITGESGTGKEALARSIHFQSPRKKGPLIAINCAALPEHLLESELFGHVRGAFTDARADRKGLIFRATGGTLLLDEIGDMPLPLQPRLLRAIQERCARPVGGDEEVPFDVRIIATTNRNLDEAVAEGSFREDLLYRINVIQIEMPPLRARGNDILLFAQHFLKQFAGHGDGPGKGLSHDVIRQLLAYSWPGNVRELQNCMERAVALARYEQITLEDLPAPIQNLARPSLTIAEGPTSDLIPLAEVERRYIQRVLASVGGQKGLAAQILGVDRKTLYRKIERWEMETA